MKKIAVLALTLCGLCASQTSLAADTAQTSGTKRVAIAGFAFKPATLTVSKETTVKFANEDSVAHTATRASFDSRRIGPGKSFSVRFNARGNFPYHCKIHPTMRGKIVVQ